MKTKYLHMPGSMLVKKSIDLLLAHVRDYNDFKVVINGVDDYAFMGYNMDDYKEKLLIIQKNIFPENR